MRFINTVSTYSVGVKLEGKIQFLTPTEKIETVYFTLKTILNLNRVKLIIIFSEVIGLASVLH